MNRTPTCPVRRKLIWLFETTPKVGVVRITADWRAVEPRVEHVEHFDPELQNALAARRVFLKSDIDHCGFESCRTSRKRNGTCPSVGAMFNSRVVPLLRRALRQVGKPREPEGAAPRSRVRRS